MPRRHDMLRRNRNNPNQKAADLISFDAFADDEDEKPLSGHGGLSLPTGPSDTATSSGAGMTSSGLPLDLFTAPSPTPSPGLGSTSRNVSGSGGMKQNPMDFFNVPSQPSFGQQRTPSMGMGGIGRPSGAGAGYQGGMSNQFGGMGNGANVQGYSLGPTSPQSNGRTAPIQQPSQPPTQPPAQTQQPPKKDAFADLVNLMD